MELPSQGPQPTLRKFPTDPSKKLTGSPVLSGQQSLSMSLHQAPQEMAPGLEQTEGSISGTGANASISDDAASPAGSTSPIARDQGPRRSGRHLKDTDTYLKEKYPDSQL